MKLLLCLFLLCFSYSVFSIEMNCKTLLLIGDDTAKELKEFKFSIEPQNYDDHTVILGGVEGKPLTLYFLSNPNGIEVQLNEERATQSSRLGHLAIGQLYPSGKSHFLSSLNHKADFWLECDAN